MNGTGLLLHLSIIHNSIFQQRCCFKSLRISCHIIGKKTNVARLDASYNSTSPLRLCTVTPHTRAQLTADPSNSYWNDFIWQPFTELESNHSIQNPNHEDARMRSRLSRYRNAQQRSRTGIAGQGWETVRVPNDGLSLRGRNFNIGGFEVSAAGAWARSTNDCKIDYHIFSQRQS